MKELSIEDKAKRYDEALERYKAKQEYESKEVHKFIEYIFPELKESEDERIRKELIEFVKSRGGFKQEYIAWLEKQVEQKPVECTNIEEEIIDYINRLYHIRNDETLENGNDPLTTCDFEEIAKHFTTPTSAPSALRRNMCPTSIRWPATTAVSAAIHLTS